MGIWKQKTKTCPPWSLDSGGAEREIDNKPQNTQRDYVLGVRAMKIIKVAHVILAGSRV